MIGGKCLVSDPESVEGSDAKGFEDEVCIRGEHAKASPIDFAFQVEHNATLVRIRIEKWKASTATRSLE